MLGTEAARFVELPPRLAQRARLGFTVVSAADDTREIDLNADVEPIRGFVLPNHLDQALAVYDRTGRYLGELRIIDGLDGNQRVFWDQAPLAPFATLDALAVQHRHLGGFLSGLQSKGTDVFQAFMAAIDETLWTVDPRGERYDQNLVVLMGRPLALVRARLRFELDRSPLADPAWPWTFAPSSPLFTGYEFPVGLGNQDDRRDGLLGYFRDEDYDQFYAVHDPDPGDVQSGGVPYVKQIGEGSYLGLRFDGSAQFVTLLVDPRGSVQARTGLLPTKTLELSARDLDAALGAMEVTFRTGPLLTSEQLVDSNQAGAGGVGTTGQQQTPSLLMPIPTEKDGTWSWVELAGAVPNEVSIASIDARARFPTRAPTLREGLLRLVGATRDEQSPPSP